MINNRQNGRRRGRGGQGPQRVGGQGQSSGGNRQDSRQRGNAAQLLEKYKSMARDAQLAGDRVQTEYFLQYADHYYRVLGESRARYDEQQRQRGDDSDEDENDDEMMMDSDEASDRGDQDDDRPQRRERNERPERTAERSPRPERPERTRRPIRDQQQQQQRNGSGNTDENGGDERIPFDALPPSIGITSDDSSSTDEVAESKPRRRTRRPRADDNDGEVAPAA